MRFALAISALVLSGIMLVLGIGQVTFLAGPHEVSLSSQMEAPNGLAVIGAEAFEAERGQENVVVEGEGAFIAVGQTRDIEAWVAPFEHGEIGVDASSNTLEFSEVRANSEALQMYSEANDLGEDDELVVPSPFGSDLWLEQRGVDPNEVDDAADQQAEDQAETVTQSVRLPVSLAPDQAVLVAAQEESSPAEVSIVWVQDRRTPWAGPLLVGGGVLALVGALLYLIAVDHDRRGLGPQRGRKGPLLGIRNMFRPRRRTATPNPGRSPGTGEAGNGSAARRQAASGSRATRRVITPAALALTGMLALSGCSPNYWPQAEPEATPEVTEQEVEEAPGTAPVPVTQPQIDRIIADIADVAGAADDSLDPEGLDARFTGDALTERTANYTIRNAASDYEIVVPRITATQLGYQLVQSTEGWPRTIFVVVASEAEETQSEGEEGSDEQADEAPSLALIMTQENPHENFLVSRTFALRGGITMPEAAPAEEGTALLADDLQSLVMPPAEVGTAYAAALAGGADVPEAEDFDLEGDSLIERGGAAWAAQAAAKAAEDGRDIDYSVTAEQSDSDVISLSTGVGGALVAATVLEDRAETPAEDSRLRLTAPKGLAALTGIEGQQDKLVSVVSHQLLFYVPSASDGGKIQLLGYTSDLVGGGNE